MSLYEELGSKNAVAKRLGVSFPTAHKILKKEALSSRGRIADSHSADGEFDSPQGHEARSVHEGSNPSGITAISP